MSNTKTVFQYDAAGFYVGETIADESPREPGVWHLPARTTEAPPPQIPRNMIPRWDGARWQLVATRRQAEATAQAAAQKLADFLASNPDVAGLVGVK